MCTTQTSQAGRHGASIRYVPANMISSAGYAWFCSCGERGGWFLVDPELGERADDEASISAIIDLRRHRTEANSASR